MDRRKPTLPPPPPTPASKDAKETQGEEPGDITIRDEKPAYRGRPTPSKSVPPPPPLDLTPPSERSGRQVRVKQPTLPLSTMDGRDAQKKKRTPRPTKPLRKRPTPPPVVPVKKRTTPMGTPAIRDAKDGEGAAGAKGVGAGEKVEELKESDLINDADLEKPTLIRPPSQEFLLAVKDDVEKEAKKEEKKKKQKEQEKLKGRRARRASTGPVKAVETTGPDKAVGTGRTFGRFQLLMEMARGGMATLYLARIRGPEKFEKLLVLKKIHDHLAEEAEFTQMFLDEARITAMIHHPHVATIFDMGQLEGSYFIAMEYVHGQNLTEFLRASVRQKKGFPWPYAARIVADAAAGLHAAHDLKGPDGRPMGVVHRDVSPQNLLVSYDGHVKVVDFGIAYAAEKISHTALGTLKGKAAYMSPEQTRQTHLDRRSDIFALGTVLFEAVCLKRLFKEETEAATLLRVREANVPKPRSIRPGLPAGLEKIILKALAKEPDDRFASAGELQQALERLLVSEGVVVGPAQLSKLMNALFYQKKKLKDEQIQRALQTEMPVPVKAFGMSGTATRLEAPTESSLQAGRGSRFLLIASILGTLLAATAVILVVVFMKRGSSESSKKGGDTPAPMNEPRSGMETDMAEHPAMEPDMQGEMKPAEMKPPKKAAVTLKVIISPARAKPVVTFRKKKYKGRVFQVVVKRSEKHERISVAAPGFHPESVLLVPTEDKEIIMTLRPIHRKTRPRDRLMDLPE